MATWTQIANTSLEPGSPARSVDAFALRDNPIAIAEGAAGSPRIETNAINDGAVTTAKIANGNVTTDKLANLSVSTAKLKTNTTSISGSLTGGNFANVSLGAYAFFINTGNSHGDIRVTFNTGVGGTADSPRLSVRNVNEFGTRAYSIQWRRVIA